MEPRSALRQKAETQKPHNASFAGRAAPNRSAAQQWRHSGQQKGGASSWDAFVPEIKLRPNFAEHGADPFDAQAYMEGGPDEVYSSDAEDFDEVSG